MARSIAAALAGLVLAGGCRQLNESHCGNQDGNLTCTQRNAEAPYCDRCTAVNDGCVAAPPIEECGEASSGPEATVSASEESTAAASTDAVDSSSTGEPNLCGNGVIDEGEVCDGELLPDDAADCDTMGYGSGPPSCQDDCSRLNYMMCPGYVEECGNNEIGADEQCDGAVFPMMMDSCDDLPNSMGPELVCTADCMIDTTDCMYCREHDEGCVDGDTCCEVGETCTSLAGLGEKKCCVANGLGGCTN